MHIFVLIPVYKYGLMNVLLCLFSAQMMTRQEQQRFLKQSEHSYSNCVFFFLKCKRIVSLRFKNEYIYILFKYRKCVILYKCTIKNVNKQIIMK